MDKKSKNETSEIQKSLVGSWKKTESPSGDAVYPDQLEFTERGIYFGSVEESATQRFHPIWDAGKYEPVTSKQLKISTANDAEVQYDFSVDDDNLVIKDENGGKIKYSRLK